MNTRSAFLAALLVVVSASFSCRRETALEKSDRAVPTAPVAPSPSPPQDPLCSGRWHAAVEWTSERGPADESDGPLPTEWAPATLDLEIDADGRGKLRVSAPEMRAQADCAGEELRAEFRGDGDGVLVLRRSAGRWKGVLRAAPKEGRVTLVATVELTPETRAPR